MEVRDKAYKDYLKGAKYKDIAEKYGVPLNTVKSWASRYWKDKDKKELRVATKKKKVATQNGNKGKQGRRGAPEGNLNAVGNNGGAPKGNQNAFKHGGYSQIYWDTLSEEEQELIDELPRDEETNLIMQIQLYTVRERRLMRAISRCQETKGGMIVDTITTSEEKKKFNSDEDRELYEEIRQQKIAEGRISYLYETSTQNMTVENTYKLILQLEAELSRVQRNKTACIEALAKIQKGKRDDEAAAHISVSEVETVQIYIPDNGRDV